MKPVVMKIAADETAASSIEYALLAALIAVVVVSAVATMGTSVEDVFSHIAEQM